jgi:hypothetical protein
VSYFLALTGSLIASAASATLVPFTDTTPGSTVFTAPVDGVYEITGIGAEGGTGCLGSSGGLGAQVVGDFHLLAGQTLSILVGGMGGSSSSGGGGGGGGFLTDGGSTTNAIGGASFLNGRAGGNGNGSGGTGGIGGGGGATNRGGGGGYTGGNGIEDFSSAGGGSSFINTLLADLVFSESILIAALNSGNGELVITLLEEQHQCRNRLHSSCLAPDWLA